MNDPLPEFQPQPAMESAPGASELPPPLPAVLACWRCAKSTPHYETCSWCRAPLPQTDAPAAPLAGPKPEKQGIQPVIGAYAAMLCFSMIVGWIFRNDSFFSSSDEESHSLFEVNAASLIVDGLWLLLMVVMFGLLPRPGPLPASKKRTRILGYVGALPLLAGLLWLNHTYHDLIIDFVDLHWLVDNLTFEPPTNAAIALAILTICIEPGVVEEWFFRYLTLGHLQRTIGVHAAVVLSSVMFGLAHIHVPLSVPMLTLVGLGLGYVRVWTGSLLLPMFLHALHNGVVLWWEIQDNQAL